MTKTLSCVWVLAHAAVLAGCTGNQSEQAKMEQNTGDQAATAEIAPANPANTDASTGGLVAGTKVALAGTTGCAHCNFEVGTTCAPAMKTAAGEIVFIDGVAKDSELYRDREKARTIKLTGTVLASADGYKHVKVESYELN